jgi:oxalate decarboxylase
MPHYIENTGKTPLRYLEVWKTNKFSDMSLRQWLAFTPFEIVQAHLKIDRSVLKNIPTRMTPVVPV